MAAAHLDLCCTVPASLLYSTCILRVDDKDPSGTRRAVGLQSFISGTTTAVSTVVSVEFRLLGAWGRYSIWYIGCSACCIAFRELARTLEVCSHHWVVYSPGGPSLITERPLLTGIPTLRMQVFVAHEGHLDDATVH